MMISERGVYLAPVAGGGNIRRMTVCGADNVPCPADLVFAADSGCVNLLKWEIESYTQTGAVSAWVRIPLVSRSADTTIYMCSGNAAVSGFQGGNSGSVWDAASVATFHLSSPIVRSSAASGAALLSAHSAVAQIGGKTGGALNFRALNQYVGANLFGAQNSGMGNGSFTISGWLRFNSFPVQDAWPMAVFGTDSTTYPGTPSAIAVDASNRPVFMIGDILDKRVTVTGPTALVAARWYHVAGVYDGATMKLYVDGNLVGSLASGAVNRRDAPIRLNFLTWRFGRFNDVAMDEVRFAGTARTGDRIRAEFTDQDTPQAFYTVGAEAGSLSAPVSSALTVTPAQLSYRIRSPLSFPGNRFLYPNKELLNLTAVPKPQAWNITITGALSNLCLYSTPCFRITDPYGSQELRTVNSDGVVAVNWYGMEPPDLVPGIYTGNIIFTPVGGGAATQVGVSLEIVGGEHLSVAPEVKSTSDQEVGCFGADAAGHYSFAVRCDIPNESPAAEPALTQPAVGATVKDLSFGKTIRRVTGPGCTTEYGSTTAFSALGTYIVDTCGVHRVADGSVVRASLPGNIATISMSASNDEAYYYMTGPTIHWFNFVTGADRLLADYSGAPYNFTKLYAGGTAGSTDDDWVSFYEYDTPAFPKICAVSLKGLESALRANSSNTYCGTYAGTIPLQGVDWAGTSEIDGPTGKRYTYLSAAPLSIVFANGAEGSGILQQEYIVPEWPGWPQNNDDGKCTPGELCYNASNFTHLALFRDRDQQVKLFGNFQDILQVYYYASTFRLNAGLKLFRPVEEGGGQQIVARLEQDRQPGCSSRLNGCVTAAIDPQLRFAARLTAAVGLGGITTLTMSAAPDWSPGSRHAVRIQNATGNWSCLNGTWQATMLVAVQLTIPANCTGVGLGLGQALLGDAAQPFSGSGNDNRGQIAIWRPGRQVQRIAMHRSVSWRDVPGTGINFYYTTPRASISRDGRYVAFNSNWGALDFDGVSVYVADTGLGDPAEQITVRSIVPGAAGATLNYDVQSRRGCQVEVSADTTFQTLTENFTTSSGLVSNAVQVGRTSALRPSTRYWVRLTCGPEVETAAFQTLAN